MNRGGGTRLAVPPPRMSLRLDFVNLNGVHPLRSQVLENVQNTGMVVLKIVIQNGQISLNCNFRLKGPKTEGAPDTSLCTGELNAIRKHNCFLCSPFYMKGVSLGYVGRIKT